MRNAHRFAVPYLLAAMACATPPAESVTAFHVDDPELARALASAAAEWSGAGLEIANDVTVNQEPSAVPVAGVTRERLVVVCELESAHDADGCTTHESHARGGGCEGIWVANDLAPKRRAVVLRHELIHCAVPSAEHLPDDVPAVFSEHGTSDEITLADMLEMARHTDVVLVHPWPLTAQP